MRKGGNDLGNMTDFGAAFLLLVFGPIFLIWGRHTLKIKEVHLPQRHSFSLRDEHPLRGHLAVQFFGYLVGGSGLLMLFSLIAALISRDGKYLSVMFFLGMMIFFFGYGGALVIDSFAPPDERSDRDDGAAPARDLDESDPWKYTRKRKLPSKRGASSASAIDSARAGASARKAKAVKK